MRGLLVLLLGTILAVYAVGCDDGADGDADADTDADGDGDADSDGDCQDLDDDGFCAGADEDCDDSDPLTHPGAEEICDGLDNDCDGTIPVDEVDADADGFAPCEGDCDDTSLAFSPDAPELCDGEDNDCDGLIDDEDDDLEDAPEWYEDLDEDGYGDHEVVENACDQPEGYVDNAEDCDDIDPDVSPDAEEICDEADNDCDGEIDEGVLGSGEECPAVSCMEIVETTEDALADGVYWLIDAEGDSFPGYCDMTTDGGGWTALINPVDSMLPATHADLIVTSEVTPGLGSCEGVPAPFTTGDWRGVRAYSCGNDYISLDLTWDGEGTDVMFLASVQGQETHTVTINGVDVPPDAQTNAYMQCSFWNGEDERVFPEENECWSTSLDAEPHVELDVLGEVGLALELEAGPSCSPDCLHGAGMNITRLFVR